MIGQENILSKIKELKENKKLAHFILIVAPDLYGKKTLAKEIAKIIDHPYNISDKSFDDVREHIYNIITTQYDSSLLLFDIHNYNYRTLEALLKITEEPPKNNYIIATVNNESMIKNTIKNRSMIIRMEPYTDAEIANYILNNRIEVNSYHKDIVTTPSLVNYYFKNSNLYEEYHNFVYKFIKIINKVEGGNALKVIDSFKLNNKDEDNNIIEINLFFEWLLKYLIIYEDKIICDKYNFLMKDVYNIIIKYKKQLNINGINKFGLLTQFIIDFRKVSKDNGFITIKE